MRDDLGRPLGRGETGERANWESVDRFICIVSWG